ncbi:MAG: hypothetical protein QW474_01050 [Candidatus Aenigmatarchaeota archaeon]
MNERNEKEQIGYGHFLEMYREAAKIDPQAVLLTLYFGRSLNLPGWKK